MNGETWFQDGHSRVCVDDESGCAQHGKDAPMLHIYKREMKDGTLSLSTKRCPRSLSSQERAKLAAKEKP